jgi:hypothetical protein
MSVGRVLCLVLGLGATAGCVSLLGDFDVGGSGGGPGGTDGGSDVQPVDGGNGGDGTVAESGSDGAPGDAPPDGPPPARGDYLWTGLPGQLGMYDGFTTVDRSGNIILATNTTASVTVGGKVHTAPLNGVALVIAKIDPTGQNVLWSTDFGSDSYIYVDQMAVDATGMIYLSGSAQGDKVTAWGLTNPHSGTNFGYIASIKPDGTFRWAITPDTAMTTGSDCFGVTTRGPAGELAITCTYSGSVQLVGSTFINLTATGSGDAFVALLDSGLGRALWARNIGGNQYDRIRSITRDANDDIVVAGASGSSSVGDGSFVLNAPPGAVGFGFVLRVSKLSPYKVSSGKAFGAAASSVQDGFVAVTGDGTIGLCAGWNGTVDFGTGPVTSVGANSTNQDVVIVGLDTTMTTARWVIPYGGTYREDCYAIDSDALGNLLVAGTHDSASLKIAGKPMPDPPPRGGGGSRAGDVFKIDAQGRVPWLYSITGSDTGAVDVVARVNAVPGSNDVVYSGHFLGKADLGSGTPSISNNNGTVNAFFMVERSP